MSLCTKELRYYLIEHNKDVNFYSIDALQQIKFYAHKGGDKVWLTIEETIDSLKCYIDITEPTIFSLTDDKLEVYKKISEWVIRNKNKIKVC